MPTYQWIEGSFAARVIEFLTKHPDEDLTSHDAGVKFDKPAKQVHSLLATAVDAGVLKRVKDSDEEWVYRLGNPQPVGAPSQAATPAPAKSGLGRPAGKKTTVIDVSAVKLEDDVPVPSPRRDTKGKLRELLNRMEPRQSCALPMEIRNSVRSAMTAIGKDTGRKFAIRTVSDSEFRLWRLE